MADTRRFRRMIGSAITWDVALSALANGTLALGLATGLAPSSIFGARERVARVIRSGLQVIDGGLATEPSRHED